MPRIMRIGDYEEINNNSMLLLDSSDCKLLLEELDHHTCKLSNYQPFHDLLKMLYEVVNETEETKDSSNG